jgi:STE24 endopeptidase
MNTLAIVLLIAILAENGIYLLADRLNLRAFPERIPELLRDVYDPDRHRKVKAYLEANSRLTWAASAFHLLVLLVFWFSGGFEFLDARVRSLGFGPVASGLLFIGALFLAKSILALPFSLYATFRIEARFGFNRTTPWVFVSDRLKGLLLSLLLGTPLLAGILFLFEHAGKDAWWLCWIAVSTFFLVLHFLAPALIFPLFNRFTPLEAGAIREAIFTYARKIGFSLENILVMDGSKRSAKSNAFFTGFGKNRRIVLFDTLIRRHTLDELVAVLAHEMGHYKRGHIPQRLALSILHSGILLYLLSFFISFPPLFKAFYLESRPVYAGLVFFSILCSPVELVIGTLFRILSRRKEREADRFAAETTGSRESMIRALKKLSADNLSNPSPHPLYVFLNASHPPVLERIHNLSE